MELRDLIVTPFVILLVYGGAYFIRPLVTDEVNRKYFFPALTLKILGAFALGFIYTFYYDGGDTFKYHTLGSRQIWNAIIDSPADGFQLLFSSKLKGDFYRYASHIPIYKDSQSFFIARIAAIFDLFTFSSYLGTAVFFAALSFTGMWMLFLTFDSKYPGLHRWIAFATLFIPSVIFWGSGIMKDTVTLACVGCSTYCVNRLFIEKRFSISLAISLLLSLFIIFSVKKYILLCFLPAVLMWIFFTNLSRLKSIVMRILLAPIVIAIVVVCGYYTVVKIGEDDQKYNVQQLAETARITAYDIRYYTGREAGSGYDIGELDGTPAGLLRLMPQAIMVSLFRPYLWEVRNPLMLLSSLESTLFLILFIYILIRNRSGILLAMNNPDVLFCIIFSVSFAFAVGVSTFNFGTLTRYKIPLLPFFVLGLILIHYHSKRDRKLEELEETE